MSAVANNNRSFAKHRRVIFRHAQLKRNLNSCFAATLDFIILRTPSIAKTKKVRETKDLLAQFPYNL